mmetsp:Transcript_17600/g.41501  ORF Transcript_17600/g.41501 Transcript_17600/m.41501 type:complete len:250 (+) Transcript_17600:959-1708(+)
MRPLPGRISIEATPASAGGGGSDDSLAALVLTAITACMLLVAASGAEVVAAADLPVGPAGASGWCSCGWTTAAGGTGTDDVAGTTTAPFIRNGSAWSTAGATKPPSMTPVLRLMIWRRNQATSLTRTGMGVGLLRSRRTAATMEAVLTMEQDTSEVITAPARECTSALAGGSLGSSAASTLTALTTGGSMRGTELAMADTGMGSAMRAMILPWEVRSTRDAEMRAPNDSLILGCPSSSSAKVPDSGTQS